MKIEGTSQTYGQLIVDGDEPEFSKQQGSSDDTVVKVVGELSEGSSEFSSNVAMLAASSKTNVAIVSVGQNSQGLSKAPIASTEKFLKVVGSSFKDKAEVKKSLEEGVKVNLPITWRSKRSESIEFVFLKVPKMNVDFIYNFFDEGEEDINSQEDPSQDPLSKNPPHKVPRYVKFEWDPVKVTNILKGTADTVLPNNKFRQEVFSFSKGVVGVSSKNFYAPASLQGKKTNIFAKEGVDQKIVDIHSPETGFETIANKQEFANSVNCVVTVKSTENIPAKIIK